jgi:hypothetical protein
MRGSKQAKGIDIMFDETDKAFVWDLHYEVHYLRNVLVPVFDCCREIRFASLRLLVGRALAILPKKHPPLGLIAS